MKNNGKKVKLNRREAMHNFKGKKVNVRVGASRQLKYRVFIDEYLKHFSAIKAAKAAGYSPKTASAMANSLLLDERISGYIKRRLRDLFNKNELTQDQVIEEVSRLAFSNIADFVEWDGNSVRLKSSSELTREQTACILEVSETPNGVKFKLHSKEKSLDMLGKYFKLFNESVDIGLSVKGGVLVVPGMAENVDNWMDQVSAYKDAKTIDIESNDNE